MAIPDVPACPRCRRPMGGGYTPSGKLVQHKKPEILPWWVRSPPDELLLPMPAYAYVMPSWLRRSCKVILLDYGKADKGP
jgi:hypothetical protein